jgi:hypothetical protein
MPHRPRSGHTCDPSLLTSKRFPATAQHCSGKQRQRHELCWVHQSKNFQPQRGCGQLPKILLRTVKSSSLQNSQQSLSLLLGKVTMKASQTEILKCKRPAERYDHNTQGHNTNFTPSARAPVNAIFFSLAAICRSVSLNCSPRFLYLLQEILGLITKAICYIFDLMGRPGRTSVQCALVKNQFEPSKHLRRVVLFRKLMQQL